MKFAPLALAAVFVMAATGLARAADVEPVVKAAPAAVPPPFFLFQETTVGYRHEFSGTDPGVGTTAKDIWNINHFDAWAYGTNFVNLDWLQSDKRDPAFCAAPAAICAPSEGALEFYGVYRGTFSFNAITHSKAFTFGPIKDIGFSFGGDWEVENNGFVPEKKAVVAGLQFQFAVPQGFLNLNVHAYKEWNHNGLPFAVNTNVEFNTVPEFEIVWMQPLTFTGLPLRIAGFTNIVTPKGLDGTLTRTKTEVLSDNRLILDAGKLMFNKPNLYDAFVGYKYWNNKFGADANTLVGAREQTFYLGFAWHALSNDSLFTPAPPPASSPGYTKAVPVAAPAPSFFLFQDTWLSYRHEFSATDPGVGTTAKEVGSISHFDQTIFGTNFVNLDWLQSDHRDPANCQAAFIVCAPSEGALEFYGVYRGTWSFNALSHSKAFTVGPIKDIAFSFGGDWETENNGFVPEKKDVVGGIQVQFAMPQGFLNVAVHAYKEWNHNGLPFVTNTNVEFKTVPEYEIQWMQPLTFTGLPLRLSGFTNIVSPKGLDGTLVQTKTEVLSDNRLTLDAGKLFANKPGTYDVFVGYKYWNNKFGADANTLPGAREQTFYLGGSWHVF
jgi:hypothetical protein